MLYTAKVKLRMEMWHVSKRQQPDQRKKSTAEGHQQGRIAFPLIFQSPNTTFPQIQSIRFRNLYLLLFRKFTW